MITLEQAKIGMTNKVDQQVIETFQKNSLMMDSLVFDDAVSPGTGGSTLGYSYILEKKPSKAGIRKLNEEYKPTVAEREEKSTNAIILGGNYTIDRVLAGTSGAVDEVAYQMEQKVKATANEFTNLAINGKKTADNGQFDGLKTLLAGSDTEFTSTLDISDETTIKENYQTVLDEVDAFLSEIIGTPDMLLMNKLMINKLRSVARRAGYYSQTKDDFGRVVDYYNGIPMQDAGKYYDGEKEVDIVPIEADGTSAIYTFKSERDGFIGITPMGGKMITQRLPKFEEAGAVKEGDVEIIIGVALKNSRKAGVLKGIKIKAIASEEPSV